MSDQLTRFAPALSATSDMPDSSPAEEADPAPPPPPSPDEAPVEPAQTPEPPTLSESIEPAPEPEPEQTAQKEPKGVGKALAEKDARIAAAERAKREAEIRAEAMQRALEQLATRIPEPTKAAEPEPPADVRPSREQYNSPEDYDTALVEWSGRVAAREARATLERQAKEAAAETAKKEAEAKAQHANQEVLLKFQEAKTKFMEENYDYSEVAERPDLSVTDTMANVIVNDPSGRGPAMAYYLGKNPEEAKRIAALSPPMQIFEMGRISSELARPKVAVSKAPEPAKPVRSSAAAAVTRPDSELSMSEYAAKRQAAIDAARRRPGQASLH